MIPIDNLDHKNGEDFEGIDVYQMQPNGSTCEKVNIGKLPQAHDVMIKKFGDDCLVSKLYSDASYQFHEECKMFPLVCYYICDKTEPLGYVSYTYFMDGYFGLTLHSKGKYALMEKFDKHLGDKIMVGLVVDYGQNKNIIAMVQK